jgi:hypothetical protein
VQLPRVVCDTDPEEMPEYERWRSLALSRASVVTPLPRWSVGEALAPANAEV